MKYSIKLEIFEGPFDLLFHLIEKNEIDIYDIPIVEITKQYMDYIHVLKGLDMDLASEFLVMAATLIEIKSKMLLPSKEFDEINSELFDNDPRKELVAKLLEYKKYREAAEHLNDREHQFGGILTREQSDLSAYVKDCPIEELNSCLEVDILVEGLKRVLSNVGKMDLKRKDYFESLRRDKFSLEDKIQEIREIILKREKMSFFSLFNDETHKEEIIVIFLSILELLKGKLIKVTQEKIFSDIQIVLRSDGQSLLEENMEEIEEVKEVLA